jgi:hypothetical protein
MGSVGTMESVLLDIETELAQPMQNVEILHLWILGTTTAARVNAFSNQKPFEATIYVELPSIALGMNAKTANALEYPSIPHVLEDPNSSIASLVHIAPPQLVSALLNSLSVLLAILLSSDNVDWDLSALEITRVCLISRLQWEIHAATVDSNVNMDSFVSMENACQLNQILWFDALPTLIVPTVNVCAVLTVILVAN